MTQTPGSTSQPPTTPGRRMSEPATEQTAWVGWVVFAAIMMLIVGSYQVIVALVALFNSDYFLVSDRGMVVTLDFTGWGWAHLIMGCVVFAAGLGILAGQTWARVVGIVIAAVSAVANMAFLPAYPLWSLLIITLDVLIIFALSMHGREIKNV